MTVIRTYADRTVVATGEVLEIYTLTPEQEDQILAYIDEHGPTPAPAFEELLGLTKSHVQRHLHDLADRGRIRSDLDRNRLVWSRVRVELDESLVRPEFEQRIREALAGRRDTSSALAKTLGLPADQVAATCTQMMLMGSLSATLIGSIRIYTVGPRLVTHTDTRRAASIPMSPEARFHEQLAKLPPARPIKIRPARPAAKAKPQKAEIPKPKAVKPRPPKVKEPRVKPVKVKEPKVKPMRPLVEAARAAGLQPGQVRGLVNRGRIRHQGIGKQALVDVADLKAYKPRLRKKKDAAGRQRRAQPEVERVYPELEGYKRVTDAARDLGVKPGTLFKWLEHNDAARALCVKKGKYLLVPPAALTQYVAATLVPGATYGTVIPEGSLTIWQAVEQVGWSYTKIYKVLAAGELTATQVGGTVYFDVEPLTALRERLDAESDVPEGWMPLTALCEELALHPSSILSWLRRRQFEVRKYRDHQRQLALHITTAGAEAYRAHRVAVPGGIKITAEVTQEILAALPPLAPGHRRTSGAVAAVAARYGVSTATIHNVLHANPRAEPLAAQDLDAAPAVAAAPIVATEPEAPAPAARPYVTVELERQLRAELTPERRKIPGETARVAERYGLSVKQVRNALSRIPMQKVG